MNPTTRIVLLAPVGSAMHTGIERTIAARAVGPGITVEVRHLPGLPPTVYVPPEEVFVPVLVRAAQAAEAEGFDAIGISCCSDPGLAKVRAAVTVPVTAPFEATAALAPAIGPLAVLYPQAEVGPGESALQGAEWVPQLARQHGVAVVGAFAVPVDRPETEHDDASPDVVGAALLRAHATSLRRHGALALQEAVAAGARTIFPACTYWTGTTHELTEATGDSSGGPEVSVPPALRVLDPIAVLARHTETLALAARVTTDPTSHARAAAPTEAPAGATR